MVRTVILRNVPPEEGWEVYGTRPIRDILPPSRLRKQIIFEQPSECCKVVILPILTCTIEFRSLIFCFIGKSPSPVLDLDALLPERQLHREAKFPGFSCDTEETILGLIYS
ncbi:hypothetical protein OCU04_004215 [Sclerotinia nivalis]|uniref:Uncharacterized protein n=1 Tax=Sclerotinia nivalis TaxID=352851 RepID=A0A9X0AQY5_9HELO|nr:hypothetical protein OCU04_004215 [Sclerotinia nivalis]